MAFTRHTRGDLLVAPRDAIIVDNRGLRVRIIKGTLVPPNYLAAYERAIGAPRTAPQATAADAAVTEGAKTETKGARRKRPTKAQE